ncbi:MAG: fumarylacetoacetate hydrolase family protein, partial [Bifidobacteriaceae bacterium]|nr:fumarylacetoacetate hydrolase family protein [Bifidobacteriaceae bacterium]
MRIARFVVNQDPGQDPRYGVVEGEEGSEVVHAIAGDPLYTEVSPTGQTHAIDDVRLLAPVIPRSKVIGVARNYRDQDQAPVPIWFGKPNTTVCGPGDPIILDSQVRAPAFAEAELAVVISRLAKDVPVDDAATVVLGYTVANDVGYRYPPGDGGANPDPRGFFGKYRDSFTPLGPWIETGLDPASALAVRSWIDGQARQDGST